MTPQLDKIKIFTLILFLLIVSPVQASRTYMLILAKCFYAICSIFQVLQYSAPKPFSEHMLMTHI